MRIILLGPPGSGKGTQANFIMQYYNVPIISVGDILRNIINHENDLSKKIQKSINSGYLVSNELVINLIIQKIQDMIYQNQGFVLDGFPRTLTQAYAIHMLNITIDIVLVFSLSIKSIIERVVNRYIHSSSGRVYHPKFNPPKKDGYDDFTGEKLTFRKDDNENIIYNRLREYHCYTEPVIHFYHQEFLINKNIRYFSIDCERNIFDVQCDLIKMLN